MANVQVGQEAPDFTLKSDSFQDVTLSSLRGKPVVIFFYPLAFSPFCTTEACAYRDDTSLFESKGAQILGISRDSVFTQKAFKEKEGLTYTLLADMKGAVAQRYGCWNEAAGVAERLTVVVDSDGKITYVEHNGAGQIRDQKLALAALG
ncbi:MAG: redoxin domain-containing protein [Chloroflexi bacterium]|nr:redoxin domain-containing protein [Chloroflexota bacterium]